MPTLLASAEKFIAVDGRERESELPSFFTPRIIQSFSKVSAVRSSTKDDVCIRQTHRELKKTFEILKLYVQQQIASNCAVGRTCANFPTKCYFILIFVTCTIEKLEISWKYLTIYNFKWIILFVLYETFRNFINNFVSHCIV